MHHLRLPLCTLALLTCGHAFAQDSEPPPESSAIQGQAAPAPAAVTEYRVSGGSSELWVVIRNDPSTTLAKMGHDHVIAATQASGTISWPADLSACKVKISVPVASLVVDPGSSRDVMGLDDNTISDKDKKKLTQNMLGKSQIWGSEYPSVTFESQSCAPTSQAGIVNVRGSLSIRGMSKEITVPMRVSKATDQGFVASGAFEVTTDDFGFSPFSAVLGALKNLNTLEFRLKVVGTPAP